ncbi:unnamed protein product [Microthlaspi erraticum]|uniref:RNase H type-1 domain-containing protein n=1 Tax=Microthlaspi erraticum TaxID=1685480 RepID=A0A6D2KDZ1_9BRAS|nr:unnamed protein product [Microthlaspi erraticum]
MHSPDTQDIETPSANLILNKTIWKIDSAPKIKHFLWKLVSRSLSTKDTLKRRHIVRDSVCVRCCQREETADHLLFECPYAQQVWRGIGLMRPSLLDPLLSFEDKLENILLDPILLSSHRSHQTVLWLLWRLWKSRNSLIFQRKAIHWRSLIRYVKRDVAEYLYAQENSQEVCQNRGNGLFTRATRNEVWKRPSQGWMKCNFDGSFHSRDEKSAVGWIIRDEHGIYRGSGYAKDDKPQTALEGEFQALTIAMEHAWVRGYRKVIFEGDCKELINLVGNTSLNFGIYNWIQEVWFWKSKFEEAVFSWVPRTANKVADMIAKRRMPSEQSSYFYSHIPMFLYDVIHNDLVDSVQ